MLSKLQRETIDRLATVRKQLRPLVKLEEELKEKLKPLGIGVHQGVHYYLIVEEASRSGFDSVALKAALPEHVWEPYWKTTDYVKLSTKAATVVVPPKARLKAA